jgi:Na+/melibiose symporter-like transporter
MTGHVVTGRRTYRQALNNPNFRSLWVSHSLAQLGRATLYVVVALYVYELTGSARELSFAVALQLLPWVVVGPLAGILADRLERKRVLIAAYLMATLVAVVLPFTTRLAQLYVLIFLINLLDPAARITQAAALPSITGQHLFVPSTSLNIVSLNAAYVIGPALGGWLVSIVGAQSAFVPVLACFLGALVFALRAKIPSPVTGDRERLRLATIPGDLAVALRIIFSDPLLRFLVLFSCIAAIGWSAPDMVAVVFVNENLGLSGREYGLLRGTVSLSLALGVFLLGAVESRLLRPYLFLGGTLVAGLAYGAVFAEPTLTGLLGLWFASGIGWGAFWLIDNALWAEGTLDHVRDRIVSLADALIYVAKVGAALGVGWLIPALGASRSLGIIGAAICTGTLALWVLGGGRQLIGYQVVGTGELESYSSHQERNQP